MREGSWCRAGFTIVELAAAIAIVAVLVCVAIPGAASARSQSKLAMCIQNLHRFANATSAYAADFDDKIWTFSWRKDNWQSQLPPGYVIPGAYVNYDNAAASAQAIYLIRTRGNRPDVPFLNWYSHVMYSSLVVFDYLAAEIPSRMAVCPEDLHRMKWQREPKQYFDNGYWLPFQPQPASYARQWPYGSSYQGTPAIYDSNLPPYRVHQNLNKSNGYYVYLETRMSPRSHADVLFPSQKVQLLDEITRHLTKTPTYYSVPQGKQPYLMFDGSVPVVEAESVDPGWIPNEPSSADATQMVYTALPWEPTYPQGMQIVLGGARWTRNGLAGIDVTR